MYIIFVFAGLHIEVDTIFLIYQKSIYERGSVEFSPMGRTMALMLGQLVGGG